jgi:hypothetical protein
MIEMPPPTFIFRKIFNILSFLPFPGHCANAATLSHLFERNLGLLHVVVDDI